MVGENSLRVSHAPAYPEAGLQRRGEKPAKAQGEGWLQAQVKDGHREHPFSGSGSGWNSNGSEGVFSRQAAPGRGPKRPFAGTIN